MIDIIIKNKSYPAKGRVDPHVAIQNFDLSLAAGEFVCLVGPSGCGKTTLLNIIAGLDNDFEGDFNFNRIQAQQPTIGYVFQNPRLLPWRTVRENIELAVADLNVADNIDFLLEVMQLKKFEHVYPERLSLGMSRRVAIIRAFAIHPELLLMDEPFVSLDAPTARQARELLLTLWQQRPHTVLFVTHDLREAIALADRIVFLTAAPMHVINQVQITIPRTERGNDSTLEKFREKLLKNHPQLT